MATPVYLKSSSVTSKVPTTSTLSLRELGVNTTDGILYLRQGSGVAGDIIIPVNPWKVSTGGTTNYNTYFNVGNVGIGTTNPTSALQVVGTTFSGALQITNSGAASTPSTQITGTWFTGGTSTTTKPQLLIEPTGTTSTSWSTSGTGLGVNAANGFTGNLLDLQVNGTSRVSINNDGTYYTYANGSTPVLTTRGGTQLRDYASYFSCSLPLASPGGFTIPSIVGASADTWLVRDSAGIFAQRNGTNAQTFRVYNTYTSSTNYELGKLEWSGNTFRIGTEKGSGGGSARDLQLQTDGTTRLSITSTGNVGIGTTNPSFTLDVSGTAAFTRISAGNTTGQSGQILQSTGTGITWVSGNVTRNIIYQTAAAGQTTFNVSYTVGNLDVYLNGSKLQTSDFSATNGSTVVLNVAAVSGDALEFITYNYPTINTLNYLTSGTTVSTSSTSTATLLSLSASSYRSVEYTIQSTQGTNYKTTKILLVHDGTNAYISEQNTILVGTDISTYDATISGGNINLLVTPTTSSTITYQVVATAISI